MKAVLYIRVSSKEQDEGYSPEAQLKLILEYAKHHNIKIVKRFIEAKTAKVVGREKFNDMLKFIQSHKDVKTILCEKTDRLSRNFKDMSIIEDLIEKQDYTIIFVKENNKISKDSNSQGKFMFYVMAAMAKNYINNLSEETRKGMTEKAEQGIYPSSAPLGYDNYREKINGSEIRYIVVDKERAPLIERVFKLYATGNYSLKSLASVAYEEGLRSRNGIKVPKSGIHVMLNNPIYYGAFKWNGKLYEGSHAPIVSKELFDAVQKAFEAQNRPKETKRGFAYTGLMTCANCGCAITGQIKKNRYIYYHCTGFRGNCKMPYIREETLSEKFADIVKKIHIGSSMVELVKNSLLDSHRDEIEYHRNKVRALESQKTKLENRIHQVYIDKLDSKISKERYDSMTNEWQQEINNIRNAIERYEDADSNYLSQGVHILELCNKAYDMYLRKEPLERAKLLRIILSNCSLDGVTLCPTYRKPFDLFAKGPPRSDWLGALVYVINVSL